jgi:hypothetical protein
MRNSSLSRSAERPAHRLQAQPVRRDALARERDQRREDRRPRQAGRLGADRAAVGVRVDQQHVGLIGDDRALEVGALVFSAREEVVQPTMQPLSAFLGLIVGDGDRFDARVQRRGVDAGGAELCDVLRGGQQDDLVSALAQCEQGGDEGEDVPGGGRGVREDAGHGEVVLGGVQGRTLRIRCATVSRA